MHPNNAQRRQHRRDNIGIYRKQYRQKYYNRIKKNRIVVDIEFNKRNLKCNICGNNDRRVLQWHHMGNKIHRTDSIKSLMFQISYQKLQIELDKCILVCANCHLILHYNLLADLPSNPPNTIKKVEEDSPEPPIIGEH